MNRVEFKEQAKQTVNDFFAKIDELEAKKNQAKDEVKGSYDRKIEKLKAEKEGLKEKYDNLMNATDEKWDETKKAFTSASESFKAGVSEITSLVK